MDGGRRAIGGDDAAVSEIVGALLLVLVVTSAAFGFGLFLHAQAKATEAQKSAELAKQLEKLDIQAVAPLNHDFNADYTDAARNDGYWNAVTFNVASEHLKETHVSAIRVNGLAVKHATIGGVVYDFSLMPSDPGYRLLTVPARQQFSIMLLNVAVDPTGYSPATCGSGQPYTFFGAPPATPPLALTDSLHIEIISELGNDFERAFQPPTAVLVVNQQGTATTSYILDGSHSDTANTDGFLTRYDWTVTTTAGACAASTTHTGRIVMAAEIQPGCTFTVDLTVTDNFGMKGGASFALTL